MNIRKPIDYSTMYMELDTLMTADLPQMKLYFEIGQLVSDRPEKGAAVMAAEYLCAAYPDSSGFSPRNLRRMRNFYRTYESVPEVLAHAMTIGWTQNVVIMESKLTLLEMEWYIQAVQQFGWSKLELQRKIAAEAHLEMVLDFEDEVCYTEKKDTESRKSVLQPARNFRHQKSWQSSLSFTLLQGSQAWHQQRMMLRQKTALAYQVHGPP